MHVFYIRNLWSLISAETIIRQTNLRETIAIIHDPKTDFILNRERISIILRKNLNNSLWSKIFNDYDPGFLRSELAEISNPFKRAVILRLKNRNLVKSKINYYENFLLKESVTDIYLPFASSIYDERLIYSAGRTLKLNINKIEDGAFDSDYGLRKYYTIPKKITLTTKKLINDLMDLIIYNKTFKSILFFGDEVSKYKFNCVYTFFPTLYDKSRYEAIIILDYENIVISQIELYHSNTSIESLILTRPLRDTVDKNLTNEIEMLEKCIRFLSGNSYIKFHPRESLENISYIISKIELSQLSENLRNLPAEYLLKLFQPKLLIGVSSNAMFLSAKFTNIKVYSLINYSNLPNRNEIRKFLNDNFKEIEVI